MFLPRCRHDVAFLTTGWPAGKTRKIEVHQSLYVCGIGVWSKPYPHCHASFATTRFSNQIIRVHGIGPKTWRALRSADQCISLFVVRMISPFSWWHFYLYGKRLSPDHPVCH